MPWLQSGSLAYILPIPVRKTMVNAWEGRAPHFPQTVKSDRSQREKRHRRLLVCSGCHNKYHRLNGLNDRHILLTVLGAGSSHSPRLSASMVLARLSSGLADGRLLPMSSCGREKKSMRGLWCLLSQGCYSHHLI